MHTRESEHINVRAGIQMDLTESLWMALVPVVWWALVFTSFGAEQRLFLFRHTINVAYLRELARVITR